VKVEVRWTAEALDLLTYLTQSDQRVIFNKASRLQTFPEMYPTCVTGRFSGCRCFVAGNWLVYYRFVSKTVFIRGIWPARIPLPE
jgi:hypothetical protein